MQGIQLLGDLCEAQLFFCKKPEHHPNNLCFFRDDEHCPVSVSVLVHCILPFAEFVSVDILVADISGRKPFLIAPCNVC